MQTCELLTTAEMAKRLRVGSETLRRFVRDGIVPAVRLSPKVIRFDPDDVATALRKQSGKAVPK